MTSHEKVVWKFQTVLYTDRLQTVKELALLQHDHSGVVAAVKTRHASRAICNQMRDELHSLKEDGLLNEKEFELLIGKIEENMTRLWSLPSSFKEAAPESLISHLSWVLGNDALKQYFTVEFLVNVCRFLFLYDVLCQKIWHCQVVKNKKVSNAKITCFLPKGSSKNAGVCSR